MIEFVAGLLGVTLLALQIYQTGITVHQESNLSSILNWLKTLDQRIDRLEQRQSNLDRRKN